MESLVSVSSGAEVWDSGTRKRKKGRRMTEEGKKKAGLALVKQGLTGEGSKRKKRLTVCFLCHRRLDYICIRERETML